MSVKATKETKQNDNDTKINQGLLAATDMPPPEPNYTDRKIMSSSCVNQAQSLPLGV